MPIMLFDSKAALENHKSHPEEYHWPEGVSVEEIVQQIFNDHRFEVTLKPLKLESNKTILFLEDLMGSGVYSKNEATLCNRARRMVKRLYENGFTNYIVSYGTDFGALALMEIAEAKDQYPEITAIAVHLVGEWGDRLMRSSQRKFQQLLAIDCCDYHTVMGVSYVEFFRELLMVPAVLCTDVGMLKNTQIARSNIFGGYRLRNAFHKTVYNQIPAFFIDEMTKEEAGNNTGISISTECE